VNNDILKQQICDALAAWIRQRPGLEFGSYGDVSSYRSEARGIARDKRDAETLLAAVRCNDSITGDMLLDAAKHSFSGRLEIKVRSHPGLRGVENSKPRAPRVEIEYTTGQYWPKEYRKAAAAVLAGALWSHMRDNMPKPDAVVATSFKERFGDSHDGMSAGDWLRNRFRKEFGSKLQRRWFN
jgi:hypothetical protein